MYWKNVPQIYETSKQRPSAHQPIVQNPQHHLRALWNLNDANLQPVGPPQKDATVITSVKASGRFSRIVGTASATTKPAAAITDARKLLLGYLCTSSTHFLFRSGSTLEQRPSHRNVGRQRGGNSRHRTVSSAVNWSFVQGLLSNIAPYWVCDAGQFDVADDWSFLLGLEPSRAFHALKSRTSSPAAVEHQTPPCNSYHLAHNVVR